jgi:hypothetical protein
MQNRADLCKRLADVRLKRASEMASCIPFGQPILIGHHSEKRDRNFRARIERNFQKASELRKRAEYYAGRAASVGTAGISSDDPEAVQKLQAEIDRAEALQARMVAANKAIRAKDPGSLAAQGFTERQISELFSPDFMGRLGFPSYALSNNNANIRRMKQRIDQLRREHSKREEPVAGAVRFVDTIRKPDNVQIVENADLNRLQILFPGKPVDSVRALLKRNGFRWSPSEGAWQRQLNDNARWAAKQVLEAI